MRYRLVALDIDGTLLDPLGKLRPTVKAAVRETLDRGVLVTLATGRRFDAASYVAEELGLELPLVLHGGTLIQDSATAEVIYEDALPPALLADLIDEVVRDGQQPVLYCSPAAGSQLLSGPEQYDSPAATRYLSRQPSAHRLGYPELARAEHVMSLAVFQDEDVLHPLYDRLLGWPTGKPLLWEPDPLYPDALHLLDVVNTGCSKAKALAHLAASFGIHMREVFAIGDQVNDLELLEAVGLGVAMGNAIPAVRARANAVVATNDQDGVVEALYKFVLNGEVRA